MLQRERQQYGAQLNRVLAVDTMSLAAHSSSTPHIRRPRPYCTHCKFLGHTEETCYHKHGWPPGMNTRTTNPYGKLIECTYCKKPEHTEEKCFSKHEYPNPRVPPRPKPQAHSVTLEDLHQEVKLTKVDYLKLMSL
ncbi:unnamed protein product [Linum trigynum]|uniref:Uncharacterized protein n=1 Tax=Linum trigynum TaxID=586398 RepID=A0AAV2EFE1_9ROSI